MSIGRRLKKISRLMLARSYMNTRWGGVIASLRRLRHGSAGVPILLYHRVLPALEREGVWSSSHIIVSRESFEKQMAYLARCCQVLPLVELCELLDGGKPLPPRAVAVTFDDGWNDNYIYAFPILKHFKIPATIFLATGFIGSERVFWQERLRFFLQTYWQQQRRGRYDAGVLRDIPDRARKIMQTMSGPKDLSHVIEQFKVLLDTPAIESVLKALEDCPCKVRFPTEANAFMDWNAAREMSSKGIELGSHTENHLILTRTTPSQLIHECEMSRLRLESELNAPVRAFAYPNGDYDAQVIERVAASGFRLAVSTVKGLNYPHTGMYRLKRINVSENRFTDPRGEFSETLFGAALSGFA